MRSLICICAVPNLYLQSGHPYTMGTVKGQFIYAVILVKGIMLILLLLCSRWSLWTSKATGSVC